MTRKSLVLAVAVAVAVAMLAVLAVGQKPNKQTLVKKAKANQAKAAALRTEIRKAKRQIGYMMTDIHKADDQLENTRAKIEKTQGNLTSARGRQIALAGELRSAQERLEQKRTMAAKRMRSLYMQGESTAIGTLMDGGSFTQASDRSFVIRKIAEGDTKLMAELRQTRQEVSEKKAEQDSLVGRIAALKQRQVAEKQELDHHVQVKRGFLGELRQDQQQAQEELDELERESRAIEADLKRYYGTAQSKRVPVYRGGFRLPVAGRISSGFGTRYHPILHRMKTHTGVDIAAPTGTPIHAAGNGQVMFAGYRGGYGNCLIIDHGAGQATLYGHCSRLYVGVGASVSAGQVIAAVGSTGLSTGPHCHWEVRINGTPVNPMGR